jgi:succinoglycan biosynthesis protein ExoM
MENRICPTQNCAGKYSAKNKEELSRRPVKVCVCIATYKRPELLARTLSSLAELKFPNNPDLDLRILVVENDPDRLAYPTVEAARSRMSWPIEYGVEERRGIPFARNRLVAMSNSSDFIAFIDDDEAAGQQWLNELMAVQCCTGAEVVLGPVESVFETAPPDWMKPLFSHKRFPDNKQVSSKVFMTGNVLLLTKAMDGIEGPFDIGFAHTGGSDGYLGQCMEAGGARFFWADKALVQEFVPESRTRVSWILRRRFRFGINGTMRNLRHYGKLRGSIMSLITSLAFFACGALYFVSSLGVRRKALLWGACFISYGTGYVAGLLGVPHKEYENIHGK